VGMAIMAFLGSESSMILVFIALVVQGIGFGFFVPPNTNAVMSSVERKYYGVASGTLSTMRLTGQAFSLGLILLLFSLIIGQIQITPSAYPLFLKTMNITFIIFAVLCFGAIFASAARGKVRTSNQPD
jgi:MFS family permease